MMVLCTRQNERPQPPLMWCTPMSHVLYVSPIHIPALFCRMHRHADSHLRQLYYYNGLSAIVTSLRAAVQEIGAKDYTGTAPSRRLGQ